MNNLLFDMDLIISKDQLVSMAYLDFEHYVPDPCY